MVEVAGTVEVFINAEVQVYVLVDGGNGDGSGVSWDGDVRV